MRNNVVTMNYSPGVWNIKVVTLRIFLISHSKKSMTIFLNCVTNLGCPKVMSLKIVVKKLILF